MGTQLEYIEREILAARRLLEAREITAKQFDLIKQGLLAPVVGIGGVEAQQYNTQISGVHYKSENAPIGTDPRLID